MSKTSSHSLVPPNLCCKTSMLPPTNLHSDIWSAYNGDAEYAGLRIRLGSQSDYTMSQTRLFVTRALCTSQRHYGHVCYANLTSLFPRVIQAAGRHWQISFGTTGGQPFDLTVSNTYQHVWNASVQRFQDRNLLVI